MFSFAHDWIECPQWLSLFCKSLTLFSQQWCVGVHWVCVLWAYHRILGCCWDTKVIGREEHTQARRIKEAIEIQRHNTMNRDVGGPGDTNNIPFLDLAEKESHTTSSLQEPEVLKMAADSATKNLTVSKFHYYEPRKQSFK